MNRKQSCKQNVINARDQNGVSLEAWKLQAHLSKPGALLAPSHSVLGCWQHSQTLVQFNAVWLPAGRFLLGRPVCQWICMDLSEPVPPRKSGQKAAAFVHYCNYNYQPLLIFTLTIQTYSNIFKAPRNLWKFVEQYWSWRAPHWELDSWSPLPGSCSRSSSPCDNSTCTWALDKSILGRWLSFWNFSTTYSYMFIIV